MRGTDSGAQGQWGSGTVGFRDSGAQGQWGLGTVGLILVFTCIHDDLTWYLD